MNEQKIYKYEDDYVVKIGWGQYSSILSSTIYSRGNDSEGLIDTGKTLADIIEFLSK